jgi:hypothetical protein
MFRPLTPPLLSAQPLPLSLNKMAGTSEPMFCLAEVAENANIFDEYVEGINCPVYAGFFGVMGATSAMIFSALGAAYGTAKSGTGIANTAVIKPDLIMKSIIPVVMVCRVLPSRTLPRA